MKPVLSRALARAFDLHAENERRVPGLVLMENAGRGAADWIAAGLRVPSARVVIVCGGGNNGGDGFVVARRLLILGHRPLVVLLVGTDRLRDSARVCFDGYLGSGGEVLVASGAEHLPELGRELSRADCIVDAIFGIGLDREVTGHFADVIGSVNRARAARSSSEFGSARPVVALDIASGLNADTGQVLGIAVRADATLTFGAHKLGILTPSGGDHSGELGLIDIGVPFDASLGAAAQLIEPDDVAALLPRRPESVHKGNAGRVVVFAGSPGKVGAALLVGQAALRAGAGLVTLASFEEVTRALDSRVLEAMTATLDRQRIEASVKQICETADAVVVGPGLGLSPEARAVVDAVLFGFEGPKVVDADALTQLAFRLPDLKTAASSILLTPHPAEMGRLLGVSKETVEADRWTTLERAVSASGATVVLKGSRTLIGAPGALPVVNVAHAPALATAGAGDVLSGILGALAARLPPRAAALSAVFLHARAGEAWQKAYGSDRGLLAHEIADLLPGVFAELTRSQTSVPD